jgi:hypothetical protein
VTTAKEHADYAREWLHNASGSESLALVSAVPHLLVMRAQNARLDFVCALVSLLRFLNALPEPVAIPPVPQPSERARKRGLLVGAVVRCGDSALRVVSHRVSDGAPIFQSLTSDANPWVDVNAERYGNIVRHAPPTREPNAEAVKRGLYIGARVVVDGSAFGEIVAWNRDGKPIVEPEGMWSAFVARPERVTLAGDAS